MDILDLLNEDASICIQIWEKEGGIYTTVSEARKILPKLSCQNFLDLEESLVTAETELAVLQAQKPPPGRTKEAGEWWSKINDLKRKIEQTIPNQIDGFTPIEGREAKKLSLKTYDGEIKIVIDTISYEEKKYKIAEKVELRKILEYIKDETLISVGTDQGSGWLFSGPCGEGKVELASMDEKQKKILKASLENAKERLLNLKVREVPTEEKSKQRWQRDIERAERAVNKVIPDAINSYEPVLDRRIVRIYPKCDGQSLAIVITGIERAYEPK